MQSKKEVSVLLGYSGHGLVVAEAAFLMGVQIYGYAGPRRERENPFELKFLGDESDANFNWNVCHSYILGVGSNVLRKKIADRVYKMGGTCMTIIHPDSFLSKSTMIEEGVFIARNVVTNPFVLIGKNSILNTSCSVDHECLIGENVHIAPGAVLAGNVTVKDGAFIGANAVIKQGVVIGRNAIIGAGSVVLKNVDDSLLVAGNPANIISK